ncbi:DNA/RNA non-specific endonuclease [Burkholderia sp. Ac-20365]|uniref:DNA/RNA non-specific endonuclease n=1 Tax=Burkholderia sp. Ac-20365 TaxID=2703897 RepID=UPI00197BF558|nr:DNA/RNA non-specific endonuclease [Burkholderia sp. Ac-20365]MBN3760747.1 hypothetical protein [Burkholderia sp. Ac-20365]
MDLATTTRLQLLFRERLARQTFEIERSLRQIAAGNPLGAEPDPERSTRRMAYKAGLPARDAAALAGIIRQTAATIDAGTDDGAESMQGPTLDLVGVSFLAKGRLVANAVGRVVFRSGRAQGSGFLVGPGLFLTNNHVIPSANIATQMVVQFDYETTGDGVASPTTTFPLDPGTCFISDPIDLLDFTLVAIGPRLSGPKTLQSLGYVALSDASDKHMLGEIANIIQHPQGGYKQLVVRENNIISRDETHDVLHYLADTEKGSSGSPVCNNDWEPIALHHWGEPHFELKNALGTPLRQDVNEGIRISSIVRALKLRASSMTDKASARAVNELLQVWSLCARSGPVMTPENAFNGSEEACRAPPRSGADGMSAPSIAADGTLSWSLPIEFSLRLPWVSAGQTNQPFTPDFAPPQRSEPQPEEKKEKATPASDDFSDRNGYEPGFIRGFVVPLPDWSKVPYRIARNQQALHGDDPHELRYHHFSIVMNADRRIALFTACNIDGRRLVAINRQDKSTNTSPTLADLGIESLGAEASDDFSPDPRILENEQMAVEFYQDQKVPGYEKPPYPGTDASAEERRIYAKAMNERTARMFQKGHITLRSDPAWGTADQALLAESDTFYYTNAAPQLGFFNQGSPEKSPAAKGKLRWRAVETFVERNAFTTHQRVSVFAGPVFDDENDPEYRFGSKLPMRFWKIAIWKGSHGLQSVALLADQHPVLERLTKGMPEGMEAYDDEEELSRVSEFISTVAEVERLTGLRFDSQVRDGDIRLGANGNESAWDFVFPA